MDNFIEYFSDYVKVREATKLGYAIAREGDSINLEQPNSKTRRGRVGHQIANTLTCSCNQGVVIEMNDGFVNRKYEEFYNKNGYIPNMFNPYNCNEIDDYSPTMTTQCGSTTSSSTVLIKEDNMNKLMQVGQLEGKHEQSNRIYSEDGICPTIMAGERKSCTGGYTSPKILTRTNKIIREIIPQQVRVRKYEVDIENLKSTLRDNKLKSKLTNKQISEILNQPLTLVEHWFRGDNCFSIPSEDIWFDLKKLLNIQTDEFDESIMEFEIRDGVFDKANRVYDSNGIAPTLTCVGAENERYKVDVYNRLYDLNKLTNKGVDNMWNNNLEKFKFEMEEIRVFDIFAGIGALHQSLKELGVPTRITNLSEIDIDATISYASGHIENFKELEFEYPTDQEMREWLINRNIGYSFEKGKSSVPRMKKDKLKLAYKASCLLNNLGDISKIKYDEIEDFDLMNMSFPCTDISGAGKQRGMKNEDGTPTRSGLYVYSINAVRSKKPKYVMIENVKALIQKKFIDDFYSIIDELEEIGYNCYYPTKQDKKGNKIPTCLNAKDFGIPQNRERIFVIAIRKDIDNGVFEFPKGFDSGIRLKDILEDEVDKKYYLSDEIQKRFKLNGKDDVNHNELNVVGSSAPECRTIGQRDITYGINGVMSTLTATDYKQPKQIIDKLDKSGVTICEQRCDEGLRFFKDNICGSLRTIDSCGDKRVIENGAIRGRYNEDGKIEQQLELRGDGVTNTLTTVEKDNVIVENNVVNRIGGCFDSGKSTHQAGSVYNTECISPTLDTMQGGYRQPCIQVIGKLECEGWHDIETRVHSDNGIAPTMETRNRGKYMNSNNFKIRKLTPLECIRLMGFPDHFYYNAAECNISDSQLYKQAGNSIVVNCLYYIFKNLFKEYIVK